MPIEQYVGSVPGHVQANDVVLDPFFRDPILGDE